jgi:predicted nucleic acid-binding Zn ribbon protein
MKKTGNPKDVVKAFRKAAKELGCQQSEERFQAALLAIGRHKPEKGSGSRRVSSRRRPGSSSK